MHRKIFSIYFLIDTIMNNSACSLYIYVSGFCNKLFFFILDQQFFHQSTIILYKLFQISAYAPLQRIFLGTLWNGWVSPHQVGLPAYLIPWDSLSQSSPTQGPSK